MPHSRIGIAHAFAGHGHNVEASLEGALAFWKLGVQERELNERCVKLWSQNGCDPTQECPPRFKYNTGTPSLRTEVRGDSNIHGTKYF